MNCQFLEPVNLGTEELPDWEFSQIECENATTTETHELIVNSEYPEREFFIDKTLSYGDILIIWFLTFFSIGLIASIIFNYFWKK